LTLPSLHFYVVRSGALDIDRCQSLGSLFGLEGDRVAFREIIDPSPFDVGDANVHVFAARLASKAKALVIVEPLHLAALPNAVGPRTSVPPVVPRRSLLPTFGL
jgi:hypothetical protein